MRRVSCGFRTPSGSVESRMSSEVEASEFESLSSQPIELEDIFVAAFQFVGGGVRFPGLAGG